MSILKITTMETTFLHVKSTAESQHARTHLERKKQGSAASKVQLEAQHAPEVNTADSNIVHCCSQNYLSLPW